MLIDYLGAKSLKDVAVIYDRNCNNNEGSLFDKDDQDTLREKGFKTEQIRNFALFIASAYHELKIAP